MGKTKFTVAEDKKTLIIERTFDAPKSKVWSAYSEAAKLEKWWGPKGWVTEVKEMKFIEGGHWLYAMTCKDESQVDWFGKSSCGKAVYSKIKPEDFIAYTDYFTNEDYEVTPGMPSSYTELEFIEKDGSTLIHSVTTFEDQAALKQVLDMGMQEGFDQTWNNLERFLAS